MIYLRIFLPVLVQWLYSLFGALCDLDSSKLSVRYTSQGGDRTVSPNSSDTIVFPWSHNFSGMYMY